LNRERAMSMALVAGAALAIAGLAWHHMAITGDGFWSLAAGHWILAHRAVPHVDPFSYASVGAWTLVSSGACVVFAAIDHLAGLRGLMIFGAALEALVVLLLWLRSAKTLEARVLLLPAALFFVQVDAEDLSCRGQLFGDLGFVLLLGVLGRVRDGKRVHPALVFVGAVLWTNLHLSFLAATFVPLLVALLFFLEPAATRPRALPLLSVSAVAALASLVNPYGPSYLPLALGTAFDPSTGSIDLFQSPDFHDPMWLVAPALGCALVVVRGAWGEERMKRPEQALLLVFLAAACMSRRFSTQLVAVEMVLAGPLLERAAFARFPPAVVAVASAVAALFGAFWLREAHDPLRDSPADAAPVAREAKRTQEAEHARLDRVVTPLHWGGYLAYAWMGQPRYFIDGRDHVLLFGNGTIEDERTLWSASPQALEVLDVYEAGVVVWPRGGSLDVQLRQDPRWVLVHADAIAVVHARRRPSK
jgi:hypothetical protein